MSTHFHVSGQDVYLLSALATLPLLVLAFFLRSPRRTQKPESTTTFGVSPQTPKQQLADIQS